MYAFCDLLQYAHDINTKIEKKFHLQSRYLIQNIIIMSMKRNSNSTECIYNNILANSYEIIVHNCVQIAKKQSKIQASEQKLRSYCNRPKIYSISSYCKTVFKNSVRITYLATKDLTSWLKKFGIVFVMPDHSFSRKAQRKDTTECG